MGGIGSGDWYRWGTRDTVERYRSLDVRRLQKEGLLREGAVSGWQWSNPGGESISHIVIRCEGDTLELSYRCRLPGEPWEDIRERVQLDWTWCHFGGWRPWFTCPGVSCGRRVAKLYFSTYFLCRCCLGLAYQCQRESRGHRLMQKAQKIRLKLGGSSYLIDRFPDKPKGMHWLTYLRLQNKALAAEMASLRLADEWIWKVSQQDP